MWNDDEHRSQHSRMSYEYRVTCAPNYYGKSCERYCNSRRDNFGHWECTETGERICISGWEGDYCDKGEYRIWRDSSQYQISHVVLTNQLPTILQHIFILIFQILNFQTQQNKQNE